jgi:hypothetical protein
MTDDDRESVAKIAGASRDKLANGAGAGEERTSRAPAARARHDSFMLSSHTGSDPEQAATGGNMAQIRIEQRRSGLGWLWLIIALIIVAVIVWFLATGAWRTTTTPARVNDTTPSSLEARPASSPSTLPAAV